jgi:hypothetical protein
MAFHPYLLPPDDEWQQSGSNALPCQWQRDAPVRISATPGDPGPPVTPVTCIPQRRPRSDQPYLAPLDGSGGRLHVIDTARPAAAACDSPVRLRTPFRFRMIGSRYHLARLQPRISEKY